VVFYVLIIGFWPLKFDQPVDRAGNKSPTAYEPQSQIIGKIMVEFQNPVQSAPTHKSQ